MNPGVMNQAPLTASQGWEMLSKFVAVLAPGYVPSSPPSEDFMVSATRHREIQDNHLVQIAAEAGCRLATRDARLTKRWPDFTLLVPTEG